MRDGRIDDRLSERRTEELLAPLRSVAPVRLRRLAAGTANGGRRRTLVILAAAIAVVGGVGAGFGVTRSRTVEARPTAISRGQEFACKGLEGMRADRAHRFFAERGLAVSWRFTRYFGEDHPDGLDGYAWSPEWVPPDALVESVVRQDERTIIVMVRGADDRNAPPLPSPAC